MPGMALVLSPHSSTKGQTPIFSVSRFLISRRKELDSLGTSIQKAVQLEEVG